jgi:hypothetical protein
LGFLVLKYAIWQSWSQAAAIFVAVNEFLCRIFFAFFGGTAIRENK